MLFVRATFAWWIVRRHNGVGMTQLIGLKQAQATVEALASADNGAHAVLLYGAEGAGKSLLADRLAQAWLCTSDQGPKPCGECAICRAFETGRAVDYQRIEPFGAGALIRKSTIERDPLEKEWTGVPVREFFRTQPLMARHKVVVFVEAERMTSEAANALLKTLEEPGQSARMILTTSAISRILPTVLSRCLAISCDLPTEEATRAVLGELEPHERVFSGGAPGLVLRIRSTPDAYRDLYALFEEIPSLSYGAALRTAERFREAAEALAKALDVSARLGNAEALRCLGEWAGERLPDRRQARLAIAEAHRRVLGNVNMSVVTDALFATIMV